MRYTYTYYNMEGATEQEVRGKSHYPRIGNQSYNINSDNGKEYPGTEYSYEYKDPEEYSKPRLKSMSICNVHTDSITVDVYSYFTNYNQSNDPSAYQSNEDNTLDIIADTYSTYYLLKSVSMPVGSTLFVDLENELCYDSAKGDLYVKLGHSSSKADVIVKEKYK